GNIGSTGAQSPNEAYWLATCRLLDIDPDGLPWITTYREGQRIRLYFNAGVYVCRRASMFIERFKDAYVRVLNAHIAHHVMKVHFTEQMLLGLVAHRFGFRWRNLPYSHNLALPGGSLSAVTPEQLRDARIVHYHQAMTP